MHLVQPSLHPWSPEDLAIKWPLNTRGEEGVLAQRRDYDRKDRPPLPRACIGGCRQLFPFIKSVGGNFFPFIGRSTNSARKFAAAQVRRRKFQWGFARTSTKLSAGRVLQRICGSSRAAAYSPWIMAGRRPTETYILPRTGEKSRVARRPRENRGSRGREKDGHSSFLAHGLLRSRLSLCDDIRAIISNISDKDAALV